MYKLLDKDTAFKSFPLAWRFSLNYTMATTERMSKDRNYDRQRYGRSRGRNEQRIRRTWRGALEGVREWKSIREVSSQFQAEVAGFRKP